MIDRSNQNWPEEVTIMVVDEMKIYSPNMQWRNDVGFSQCCDSNIIGTLMTWAQFEVNHSTDVHERSLPRIEIYRDEHNMVQCDVFDSSMIVLAGLHPVASTKIY